MKRLRSLGLGVKKKQAEPITVGDETLLWDKGQLGDHSPQTLLGTMIYLLGIHFALRSGQEHRSLQTTQFEVVHPTDGELYLVYTENVSKTIQEDCRIARLLYDIYGYIPERQSQVFYKIDTQANNNNNPFCGK